MPRMAAANRSGPQPRAESLQVMAPSAIGSISISIELTLRAWHSSLCAAALHWNGNPWILRLGPTWLFLYSGSAASRVPTSAFGESGCKYSSGTPSVAAIRSRVAGLHASPGRCSIRFIAAGDIPTAAANLDCVNPRSCRQRTTGCIASSPVPMPLSSVSRVHMSARDTFSNSIRCGSGTAVRMIGSFACCKSRAMPDPSSISSFSMRRFQRSRSLHYAGRSKCQSGSTRRLLRYFLDLLLRGRTPWVRPDGLRQSTPAISRSRRPACPFSALERRLIDINYLRPDMLRPPVLM